MKVVSLKDKSLFDVGRGITSIFGEGKLKSTEDKDGFIVERTDDASNQYHILIIKKIVDVKTKNVSFSVETEEGSLNPMILKKSIKLKNLSSVEICFPNIMIGEDKKIRIKVIDFDGKIREIELRKDSFVTHSPGVSMEKPKKGLKRYKKDDIIFQEGDIGNEMYIIQKGKVGLFKNTKDGLVELGIFDKSNFFGEMALLGDPHRSATAKAIEDSDLLIISKQLFEFQLKKVPSWFVTMFKALIERLRNTDELFNSAKHQIAELEEKIPKEKNQKQQENQ